MVPAWTEPPSLAEHTQGSRPRGCPHPLDARSLPLSFLTHCRDRRPGPATLRAPNCGASPGFVSFFFFGLFFSKEVQLQSQQQSLPELQAARASGHPGESGRWAAQSWVGGWRRGGDAAGKVKVAGGGAAKMLPFQTGPLDALGRGDAGTQPDGGWEPGVARGKA